MGRYGVWRQQLPVKVLEMVRDEKGEAVKLYAPALVSVGEVDAESADDAIEQARSLRLAQAPIVARLA